MDVGGGGESRNRAPVFICIVAFGAFEIESFHLFFLSCKKIKSKIIAKNLAFLDLLIFRIWYQLKSANRV